MSYVAPAVKKKTEATGQPESRIRITLTSRKVAILEKVCAELVSRSKSKELPVKGPIRLPTKNLVITTRKTPNGEGSKTWDRFEMRIHKRYVDLTASVDVIRQITSLSIDPAVNVEITIQ